MTKQEYLDYCERVANYLDGIDYISTGDECGYGRTCEICKGLAGTRYDWQGVVKATDEKVNGTCCGDCLYYLNYGRLDDSTMIEIND